MARPDIKDERREQILDAFETVVARYGIEGATLARTAEEAELARPLIRHNVGNREELLAALTERFKRKSREAMRTMIMALPKKRRLETLIEWLFDPQFSDAKLLHVSNALIAASATDAALAGDMQDWLNEFVGQLDEVIATEYPDAPPDRVAAVAAGLTGIYFNVEALTPLGDIEALAAASRDAATLLIESLRS